jgi:hypothetical protein
MNWFMDNASRYATPEVATVVGTLVGGIAAWKAMGWAVRGAVAMAKHLGATALTLSGTTILGATSVGYGLAELNDQPALPGMAVAAGLALMLVAMINAIARTFPS